MLNKDMINIFLSASVPLPHRHEKYHHSANVLAIREALKALVEVVLPLGRITCGGHPAITPLISLFVQQSGLDRDHVTIFQSLFYKHRFPPENKKFLNIRYTPSVPGDEAGSLLRMRRTMISSQRFDAAVFIGGMEGVEREAQLFREIHKRAPMLPVASTGAAAEIVFGGGDYPGELRTLLTYQSLFRKQLIR